MPSLVICIEFYITHALSSKFKFEFDFCKINDFEFEFSFFKVNQFEFEFQIKKKWMDPTLRITLFAEST